MKYLIYSVNATDNSMNTEVIEIGEPIKSLEDIKKIEKNLATDGNKEIRVLSFSKFE